MNGNLMLRRSIITGVIYTVIGLLMLVIPYDVLKDMLFAVIGIGIVILNIFPCILYWMSYERDKSFLAPAIMATVSVAVGFVFIFWHNWIMSIILALWLIVFPIIRIVQADNKKEIAKKQIVYFVIAAFLFFVPADAIFEVVIKVFGAALMLLGVIDIVYTLISNRRMDNEEEKSNPDGVIIDAKVEEVEK